MNDYKNHLMKCINNSRDIALRELPHLGPQEQDPKEETDKWYDTILEWISKNPPTFYVKYLEVTESFDSKITAIQYVYYEKNEVISEASIKVISELYSI